MIKANRKYRIGILITTTMIDDLEVVAVDEEQAEQMAQKLIDAGAYNTYLNENKHDVEAYVEEIEDIGNAIGE